MLYNYSMLMLLYGYIFYYISATIGLSIGYHRYFTHRSFSASPFFEYIMLFFGLICGGRGALTWCAVHRMHHAKSDTVDDPHSPKYKGALNILLSRWTVSYIPKKFVVDLIRNPRVVFFHKYGKYIHLAYGLIMLALGLEVFFVFVISPFVLSYVGFGLLNYFGHKDGEPKNAPWINLVAPGEGWHKNHHNTPRATSLHKYDIAGWIIERFFTTAKSSS